MLLVPVVLVSWGCGDNWHHDVWAGWPHLRAVRKSLAYAALPASGSCRRTSMSCLGDASVISVSACPGFAPVSLSVSKLSANFLYEDTSDWTTDPSLSGVASPQSHLQRPYSPNSSGRWCRKLAGEHLGWVIVQPIIPRSHAPGGCCEQFNVRLSNLTCIFSNKSEKEQVHETASPRLFGIHGMALARQVLTNLCVPPYF